MKLFMMHFSQVFSLLIIRKREIIMQFCIDNLKEKDIPEKHETDGRMILKYILKK